MAEAKKVVVNGEESQKSAVTPKKTSIADLAKAEELTRLREELANLKKQINQKPKLPEFDIASALKEVSTPFLKHVATELDKVENKQERFNELKAQLPNMIRSKDYSNSFINQALEKKNLSQKITVMTPENQLIEEIEKTYSAEEQIYLNASLKNMLNSMKTDVRDSLGPAKLVGLFKK